AVGAGAGAHGGAFLRGGLRRPRMGADPALGRGGGTSAGTDAVAPPAAPAQAKGRDPGRAAAAGGDPAGRSAGGVANGTSRGRSRPRRPDGNRTASGRSIRPDQPGGLT